MNIYYRNEKAALSTGTVLKTGSELNNVYDPMLELRADFTGNNVVITGRYNHVVAIDSLCLGNTNAIDYQFTAYKKEIVEGTFSGRINVCGSYITVHNFDETVFADQFELELETLKLDSIKEAEPLYLGHLFVGQKTVLPRFAPEAETGMALTSEASRSFGGQVYGMRRITLDSFGVKFPRLTADERSTIKEYVKAVQNIEPHIIDPYHGARAEFPPMYVTLSVGEVSQPKRDEDGFYFSGSLAWQEAR
jgi:hypothetical protein